jgi:hypothetical protein
MAQPNIVTIRMEDSEGKFYSVPIYTSLDTVAAVDSFLTTFAPALKAVSSLGIVGAFSTFTNALPVGVGTITTGRGDQGATLSFVNEVTKAHSLYIPGFLGSLLEAGAVLINETPVVDLANLIIGGASKDRFGLDLTDLRRGIQSVRKVR